MTNSNIVLFLLIINLLISCRPKTTEETSSTSEPKNNNIEVLTPPINLNNMLKIIQIGTDQLIEGSSIKYQLKLTTQPKNDVRMNIISSDPTQYTINKLYIDFSPLNWNSLDHIIEITAADDTTYEPIMNYSIITMPFNSADSYFANKDPADIPIILYDNDTAGVIIALPKLTAVEGTSFKFYVSLKTKPTKRVIINISSDQTNAVSDIVIYNGQLRFEAETRPLNNSVVTIQTTTNKIAEGSRKYKITFDFSNSLDEAYAILPPQTYQITITDNDNAEILVSDKYNYKRYTSETGQSPVTLLIKLNSEPIADVLIPLTINDTSEASLDIDLVSFTKTNWMTDQEISILGVDDNDQDGTQEFTVQLGPIVSSDVKYKEKIISKTFLNYESGNNCSTIKENNESFGDGVYYLTNYNSLKYCKNMDLSISPSMKDTTFSTTCDSSTINKYSIPLAKICYNKEVVTYHNITHTTVETKDIAIPICDSVMSDYGEYPFNITYLSGICAVKYNYNSTMWVIGDSNKKAVKSFSCYITRYNWK